MDDASLLRYSRHILLPQIDLSGQQRILEAKVLLIGVGGLGSAVALYLGAAGVGSLVLVDDDQVELTNLQRQIAHRNESIGQNKVDSAASAIYALNPEPQIETISRRLSDSELRQQIAKATVVIDCSDNFATRNQINSGCVAEAKPLVWGAAVRFEGQISVYNPDEKESGCYRCIYQEDSVPDVACREMGVFTPLVGMVGTTQASEALKLILGRGRTLVNRLLLIDALNGEWRQINYRRQEGCLICG